VEITTIMFYASAPPALRSPPLHTHTGAGATLVPSSPETIASFGTPLSRSAVDQLAQMLLVNRGLRSVCVDDLLHDEQIVQLDEAIAGRALHCDTIR